MRQQRELQRGSMELNINKNAATTKLENCDYFRVPTNLSNNHNTSVAPSADSKVENGGPCGHNGTLNQNSNSNSIQTSQNSILNSRYTSSPQEVTPNCDAHKDHPDSTEGWEVPQSQSEHQSPLPPPSFEHLMNGNCNNPLIQRDRRISAINLSRLQRNMVEICSIMKESGIPFSIDNENNN